MRFRVISASGLLLLTRCRRDPPDFNGWHWTKSGLLDAVRVLVAVMSDAQRRCNDSVNMNYSPEEYMRALILTHLLENYPLIVPTSLVCQTHVSPSIRVEQGSFSTEKRQLWLEIERSE